MATTTYHTQKDKKKDKIYGVYIKSVLTKKIVLSITEIGKNIKQNLEKKIVSQTEGRCIAEGFIRPNSVRVISYSAGIVNMDKVEFHTIFECMICHPVDGMLIECHVKTITKAGIQAHVIDKDEIIPVVVFLARDHHTNDKSFGDIKENTRIVVRVIGTTYELNDPHIYVIGKLVQRNRQELQEKKARLRIISNEVIKDDAVEEILGGDESDSNDDCDFNETEDP